MVRMACYKLKSTSSGPNLEFFHNRPCNVRDSTITFVNSNSSFSQYNLANCRNSLPSSLVTAGHWRRCSLSMMDAGIIA